MSDGQAVFAGAARRGLRLRRLAVDGIGTAGGLVCAFAGLRIWNGGDAVELAGAALLCFCLCVAAVLLRAGE
jgi:hypothetical protein